MRSNLRSNFRDEAWQTRTVEFMKARKRLSVVLCREMVTSYGLNDTMSIRFSRSLESKLPRNVRRSVDDGRDKQRSVHVSDVLLARHTRVISRGGQAAVTCIRVARAKYVRQRPLLRQYINSLDDTTDIEVLAWLIVREHVRL